MLKLWVRNTLLFFVVIAISTFAGWCAYTVTRNGREEDKATQVSATGARQDDMLSQGDADDNDCYTVRLENEKICVYALIEGREEFLYSVDVYGPDLPQGDKLLLEGGVRLENASQLTAFMEDYTS